jgi:hypothetical protein
MVCPCCGKHQPEKALECGCGAKSVGLPLTDPEWIAPKLGFGIAAIVFSFTGLLMLWIKPVGLIALIGLYLGYKGIRFQKTNPLRYGGLRLAKTGFILSFLMVGTNVGFLIAGVPKAIRAYQGRRFHTTVANMQGLTGLLTEYQREYGRLPEELNDLKLVTANPIHNTDFWDQEFRFTSTSLIAARGNGPQPRNSYEIRSAGADGIFGTADDIIMQDGHIIDQSDSDPTLKEAAPVEPVKGKDSSKNSRKR